MKRSAQLEATIAELEKHGAEVLSISDGAKHGRVYFAYEGKEQYIVVGGNASDHRAPDNCRKHVRHRLGIKREKVTGSRRSRRNYADPAAPTGPDHFTLKADPWAALAGTRIAEAATAIAADRAWARLFGLCLREVGHVPLNANIHEASAPEKRRAVA